MTWFNNLGLRAKLMGSFGVVLGLLAIVGFIGWKNTRAFSADFKSLYVDRLQPVVQLDKAKEGLYELRLGALAYGQSDAAGRAKIRADESGWLKQIDDNMRDYAATHLVQGESDGLKIWNDAYPAYLKTRQQVLAFDDQGKPAEAQALRIGDATQLFGKARAPG